MEDVSILVTRTSQLKLYMQNSIFELIDSLYCSVSVSPCKKSIRMKVLKYKSQILIVYESNQNFKMQNL